MTLLTVSIIVDSIVIPLDINCTFAAKGTANQS